MTLEKQMIITMKTNLINNQKFLKWHEKLPLLPCSKKEKKSLSTIPLSLKKKSSIITSEEVIIILFLMVMDMDELTP